MTNSKEESVSVVALEGWIVFDKGSNALREQLKSLLTARKKNIVLDMKSIEHIDGSGLGILVAAHLSAKAQGASLRLCRLSKHLRKVLEITKLATVFQICDPDAGCCRWFLRDLQ